MTASGQQRHSNFRRAFNIALGHRRSMQQAILRHTAATEFATPELCHITELSNGAHDPGLSIARARVEPGVTTRWHRLINTSERYVILEGSGRVEIGTLPPQNVSPGDIVLIPPFCPQRISNTGTQHLVFLALCTPRFLPESYEDIESSIQHP